MSLQRYAIVAINVAVYLFGLASPVDTVGVGTSTLPVLYGAKVNALILGGEWWRLITPMFLVSVSYLPYFRSQLLTLLFLITMVMSTIKHEH